MTISTWIALVALGLSLYNFLRQEITRVKNKPRLSVQVQKSEMASVYDGFVTRSIVHVTVRALGGKVGLQEVTFEWVTNKPESGWGFGPAENEFVSPEVGPIGDPFNMKRVLNELDPVTWSLRLTRPQGNKNGLDDNYELRAVAVAVDGKKYYSESFWMGPDLTTDATGNVIPAP